MLSIVLIAFLLSIVLFSLFCRGLAVFAAVSSCIVHIVHGSLFDYFMPRKQRTYTTTNAIHDVALHTLFMQIIL